MNLRKFGIFALVLSIFGIAVLAQREPRVEDGDPRLHVQGEKLSFQGDPFAGILVKRHLNGKLSDEIRYSSGLPEGNHLVYHHNGRVIARWRYKLGKRHGRQTGWYPDGKFRFESDYDNGLLHGKYVELHPNGKLYREQRFNQGVETAQKVFYEQGAIYANYVKSDGRIYGQEAVPLCGETKKEGEK